MWVYFLLLVLGFVILESITVRNQKAKKQPINLFATFRHIYRRRKLSAEDSIALSGFSFVLTSIYIVGVVNWTTNFGPTIVADKSTPNIPIPTETAENETPPSTTQTQEVTESALPKILEENTEKFIRTYEETEFAFLAAKPVIDIYQEAEDMSLLNGAQLVLEEGSSGGKSVYAGLNTIEKPGTILASDPSIIQPAGTYEVALIMKVSDNSLTEEVLRFAVVDAYEQNLLYERNFRASDFIQAEKLKTFRANYKRENTGSVQFKIYFEDKVDVIIDRIEISPLEKVALPDDVAFLYPDLEDKTASGQKSRQIKKEVHLPGRIAFGPYDKSVKAGKYRARFYLDSDMARSDKEVVLLDISSDGEGFVPSYMILTGNDFDTELGFQGFDLDFEKKSDVGYLEFRVYAYGTADLLKFDRVDLYQLDSNL
jgi:hypothetical protein